MKKLLADVACVMILFCNCIGNSDSELFLLNFYFFICGHCLIRKHLFTQMLWHIYSNLLILQRHIVNYVFLHRVSKFHNNKITRNGIKIKLIAH